MQRLNFQATTHHAVLTTLCAMAMLGAPEMSVAQSAPVLAPAPAPTPVLAPVPAPASTLPARVTAPAITWASLTNAQKTALAPLQTAWDSLSDGHQRKWIALSQNFGTMSESDKEKLQSRMGEWAALKPKERQQARLNFAETKKTPAAERAANWEAYQALSHEEKEALAKKAAAQPAGAAIAAKAPSPQKLTPVPLTRNTPESQREKLATQQPVVDRNTLLPLTTAKPTREQ